jgi:hypothetical protein
MRILCQKYAYSFLLLLLKSRFFSFLAERAEAIRAAALGAATNTQEHSQPDSFLLYGSEYSEIRTTWSDLLFRSGEQLQQQVQSAVTLFAAALQAAVGRIAQPALRPLIALLALQRALRADDTGLRRFEELLRNSNQEILQPLMQSFDTLTTPAVATAALQSLLPRGALPTSAQTALQPADDLDVGLRELEAHFQLAAVLLTRCNRTPPFLQPLLQLAMSPAQMRNAFLPTMPSDEMFDVRNAIQQRGENLHYYTCPNGHTFAVGECGNPQEASYCRTCRAPIGMGHHTGNRAIGAYAFCEHQV